jgi:hypothetical protein
MASVTLIYVKLIPFFILRQGEGRSKVRGMKFRDSGTSERLPFEEEKWNNGIRFEMGRRTKIWSEHIFLHFSWFDHPFPS